MSRKSSLPESKQLKMRRYLREHGLLEDPVIRSLDEAAAIGKLTDWGEKMLYQAAHKHHANRALSNEPPFHEPKSLARAIASADPSERIYLGNSYRGTPLYMLLAWLHFNLLLVGGTGSGKSNWLLGILRQFLLTPLGLWVFDLYKDSYRHLIAHPDLIGVPIAVVGEADAKINELISEGDPRLHVAVITDNLARHLRIPDRGRTVLKMAIIRVYEAFGVFTRSVVHLWPTLFDVYVLILGMTGKDINKPARDAILDRMGAYLASKPGAYRMAWRASDLAGRKILFEYRGTSEQRKGIELNYLIRAKMDWTESRGIMNSPLKHITFTDDSQRFLTSGTADGDIAPITELLGVQRGSGSAYGGSLQGMEGVGKGLLSNMGSRIIFRLGTAFDMSALGADMSLSAEQQQWAMANLRQGLAIMTLAEGPYRDPFIIRSDKFELTPMVSDLMAQQSLRHLDDLPVVRAEEFDHFSPYDHLRIDTPEGLGLPEDATADEPAEGIAKAHMVDEPPVSATASTPSEHTVIPADTISKDEHRFLIAVRDHPMEPSRNYAKLAAMGSAKAIRIRKALLERGLLVQDPLATGARGRAALLIRISTSGEAALASYTGKEKA